MVDLRAELLAAFAAELADHLAVIRAGLADAEAGRPIELRDLSRRAHSLKGAARAVEQPATEALAHDAETLLLTAEADGQLDRMAVAELRRIVDAIEDAAAGDGTEPAPGAIAEAAPDDRLRVGGRHVERIAASVHDLTNQVQQGAATEQALEALQLELSAVAALATKAGGAEIAARIARASTEVRRVRREQARARSQLERTAAEIERDAERILLSPVATLFEGHERMVRELAASQGKTASLRIEAVSGEADRRVLQALREPVLHLLRNAVSHGIESPPERLRAGKPDEGLVVVAAALEGGRLDLRIRDDGRGLDYRRIEARARAAGLVDPRAPRPSPEDLRAMLFEQGFSTAEVVDEISGRGLGLAVVAETVRRLHGQVTITAAPGGGAETRLSLPSTLTRQPILLVETGGETFGVPATAIVELARVRAQDIERSEGAELVTLGGRATPLRALADMVGALAGTPDRAQLPVLVLEADGQRLALAVDVLADVRSLVVGDPVAIAAHVPLVYGTALVEDKVALVLSPQALVAQARTAAARTRLAANAGTGATVSRRSVLVVDDSITTRTLERSILEAQGYEVLVNVDGLEALERLRSGLDRVDLVVADVEMPRMDGFALLTAIRNDPALSALPVIMMTSRNSPDDVQRGLDLGADAYVTKQEFDQGRLVAIVQQLI